MTHPHDTGSGEQLAPFHEVRIGRDDPALHWRQWNRSGGFLAADLGSKLGIKTGGQESPPSYISIRQTMPTSSQYQRTPSRMLIP